MRCAVTSTPITTQYYHKRTSLRVAVLLLFYNHFGLLCLLSVALTNNNYHACVFFTVEEEAVC
jgi:hypothetical protein